MRLHSWASLDRYDLEFKDRTWVFQSLLKGARCSPPRKPSLSSPPAVLQRTQWPWWWTPDSPPQHPLGQMIRDSVIVCRSSFCPHTPTKRLRVSSFLFAQSNDHFSIQGLVTSLNRAGNLLLEIGPSLGSWDSTYLSHFLSWSHPVTVL